MTYMDLRGIRDCDQHLSGQVSSQMGQRCWIWFGDPMTESCMSKTIPVIKGKGPESPTPVFQQPCVCLDSHAPLASMSIRACDRAAASLASCSELCASSALCHTVSRWSDPPTVPLSWTSPVLLRGPTAGLWSRAQRPDSHGEFAHFGVSAAAVV